MQSILGALLTAGYAAAVASAIASSPDADQISDSVQTQLQKSFSSAEQVAEQYPQYSQAIIAGARSSFLDGADWAYTAGIVAIVLGAAVVFFLFPRRDQERALLHALPPRGHRVGGSRALNQHEQEVTRGRRPSSGRHATTRRSISSAW